VKLSRPDGRDSYISFPTEKLKVKVEKKLPKGWKHWEFKLKNSANLSESTKKKPHAEYV
jgi:hypothetical protein